MRGGRGEGKKPQGEGRLTVGCTRSFKRPQRLRRGQRASVPSVVREGGVGVGWSGGARAPWPGRTDAPGASAPGLRSGKRELLAGKSLVEAAPEAQLLRSRAFWRRGSAPFVPLGFACFWLSTGHRGSQARKQASGWGCQHRPPRGAPRNRPSDPSTRCGWEHSQWDPHPPTQQPSRSNYSWSPTGEAADFTYGKTLQQELA